MEPRKLFNMDELRFAGLVMVLEQNLEQGLLLVMLVEVQVCRQCDKVLSSCKQCVEYAMVSVRL